MHITTCNHLQRETRHRAKHNLEAPQASLNFMTTINYAQPNLVTYYSVRSAISNQTGQSQPSPAQARRRPRPDQTKTPLQKGKRGREALSFLAKRAKDRTDARGGGGGRKGASLGQQATSKPEAGQKQAGQASLHARRPTQTRARTDCATQLPRLRPPT